MISVFMPLQFTRIYKNLLEDLNMTGEWFYRQTALTGAEFYRYAVDMAGRYGWTYGGEIAGHLIGQFPHERLEKCNRPASITPL